MPTLVCMFCNKAKNEVLKLQKVNHMFFILKIYFLYFNSGLNLIKNKIQLIKQKKLQKFFLLQYPSLLSSPLPISFFYFNKIN